MPTIVQCLKWYSKLDSLTIALHDLSSLPAIRHHRPGHGLRLVDASALYSDQPIADLQVPANRYEIGRNTTVLLLGRLGLPSGLL